MKRKAFLNRMALGTGGALLLPSLSLVQGCEYSPKVRKGLTEADITLLDEIGETIIPSTALSPGAKATNIGEYILLMYTDCMPLEEQMILLNGVNALDERAFQSMSSSFIAASDEEKLKLLEQLQVEADAYYLSMQDEEKVPVHYFSLLKNLTMTGYFTSKIGMTQARNYLPLPGRFEACIAYNPGDKPWAS